MIRHKRKSSVIRVLSFTLLLLIVGVLIRTSIISQFPSLIKLHISTRVADTSQWNLIIVNEDYRIPNGYKVELTELSNGEKVDSRIYPELQAMFNAARVSGLQLFVREGYRTRQEQQEIMDDKIREYEDNGYTKKEAKNLAEKYVAVPGTSEHQLGLSVDINADTSICSSEAVYTWLAENSYKYGFIKRYPSEKIEITGINNEPWHYRYVGKDVAKEIIERNLCLEEYIEQLETKIKK